MNDKKVDRRNMVLSCYSLMLFNSFIYLFIYFTQGVQRRVLVLESESWWQFAVVYIYSTSHHNRAHKTQYDMQSRDPLY